jgi:hypothetical protein
MNEHLREIRAKYGLSTEEESRPLRSQLSMRESGSGLNRNVNLIER